MGRRVEDEGGSDCRSGIGRIGVEPSGKITPRESGLTSLGCLRTRPSDQPAWETEQMTAASLLVRSPACSARWPQTSNVQVGRSRPTGSREGPWERLERHKPKGFRVVLRGLGSSNVPRLPGLGSSNAPRLPGRGGSNASLLPDYGKANPTDPDRRIRRCWPTVRVPSNSPASTQRLIVLTLTPRAFATCCVFKKRSSVIMTGFS